MNSPASRPPTASSDWAPRATRERIAMERLPAAARHGESSKDVDLERLEDSLRWLQRQAAGHLPRVAPVPLISGLTPLDTPHYNNRERIGRRRAKSLEPELMPPPPSAPLRHYLRASLALFSTSIVVAVAGYYIGQTGWSPPTLQVATRSPPKSMASPTVGARAMRPILARDDDPDTLPANEASDRARGIAELAKMPPRPWHWARPTIPWCMRKSVSRDWARTSSRRAAGIKRPRGSAQWKRRGGCKPWPIVRRLAAAGAS